LTTVRWPGVPERSRTERGRGVELRDALIMNRDELEQPDLEVAASFVLAYLLQLLLLPRPVYACSTPPHGYRPSIDDPHTPSSLQP
jgi:hypothetical protein